MTAWLRFGGMMAFGVFLLAGCAEGSDGDCDPTQGGLFQGIRCSGTGGGFDQRVNTRKNQEAALLTRKADLTRESEQIEAERQTVAADLARKQAEYKRATFDRAAIERKLKTSQKQNSALKHQQNNLESEIARTKTEIDELSASDAAKLARLVALQKERDNINKEYEAAIGR